MTERDTDLAQENVATIDRPAAWAATSRCRSRRSATPTGSLTLRVGEGEGIAFLAVYKSNAEITEAAEYGKVEIDERLRGRGSRLGDAPITDPFFVRVSTTDGDDQEIQNTGLVQLVPAPGGNRLTAQPTAVWSMATRRRRA